jgi:hypothetical protein
MVSVELVADPTRESVATSGLNDPECLVNELRCEREFIGFS